MKDPMLLRPELPEYRYALYPRSYLIGLADSPDQPVAVYRDEALAIAHGGRMWPSTYTVVDLSAGDAA